MRYQIHISMGVLITKNPQEDKSTYIVKKKYLYGRKDSITIVSCELSGSHIADGYAKLSNGFNPVVYRDRFV